jgi:hypothetical protein
VEIRNVLFANSALAAAQLEGCMMQRVPLAGGWTEVPETKGTAGRGTRRGPCAWT